MKKAMTLLLLVLVSLTFVGGCVVTRSPYAKCLDTVESTCGALQPGLNLANPNTEWQLNAGQTVITTTEATPIISPTGNYYYPILTAKYNYILVNGQKVASPICPSTSGYVNGAYRACYNPSKPTLDLMTYFNCKKTEITKC